MKPTTACRHRVGWPLTRSSSSFLRHLSPSLDYDPSLNLMHRGCTLLTGIGFPAKCHGCPVQIVRYYHSCELLKRLKPRVFQTVPRCILFSNSCVAHSAFIRSVSLNGQRWHISCSAKHE